MSDAENRNDIRSAYLKLCTGIILVLLVLAAVVEIAMKQTRDDAENIYRIEINRVERQLEAGASSIDISAYETILGVYPYDESDEDFFNADSTYVIRNVGGRLYRIDYRIDMSKSHRDSIRKMNLILVFVVLTTVLIEIWVYFVIIRNFNDITEFPYKLAKGNLTTPLKENKNRYFGRFIWGLDMLREKLETEKRKNLEFQKEKNLFLLSLSHDTKTPLSAIKLYAAAMKKNLYKDPEKQAEIGLRIDENVNEIEGYISKIISSSGEDFMNFDVECRDFYLSSAINEIKTYYAEKLREIGTEFSVGEYTDILVKGDKDRFVEVLQNLMENAIKYGDGVKIGIDFSDEDGARLVSISNTGCTLPESEVEHIFDSFYRGSNVGNKSGSGLGLYIAKKLMGRMKGDIFAKVCDNVMKVTLVCLKS